MHEYLQESHMARSYTREGSGHAKLLVFPLHQSRDNANL